NRSAQLFERFLADRRLIVPPWKHVVLLPALERVKTPELFVRVRRGCRIAGRCLERRYGRLSEPLAPERASARQLIPIGHLGRRGDRGRQEDRRYKRRYERRGKRRGKRRDETSHPLFISHLAADTL